MSSNPAKTTRAVQIADYLWRTFEDMAEAMGSDREGLINQAMFTFARLNGFLNSGITAPALRAMHTETNGSLIPDEATDQGRLSGEDDAAQARLKEEVSTARKYIGVSIDEGEAHQDGAAKSIFLVTEDGKRDGVNKDRFLIGRGRHCDFVINSGKVSREHAAIIREGSEYFIEDLGSSNGTWFNKQRISRRKIDDGDEYFICNEKIKIVMQ